MITCSRWLPVSLMLLAATSLAGAATTQLLTPRFSGATLPAGGNADSAAPRLSADGRFVLFSSVANNLVTNGNNQFAVNLYLRDRASNTTTLVTANLSGIGGGNASSFYGQVSTNGRYVVFQSDATDLLLGDTNEASDVFVRDLQTGSNILVSVAMDGGWGNGASSDPIMTPDRRYVAFWSEASNLVPGDTNAMPDLFVRDLMNQTTTLATVGAIRSTLTLTQPYIIPSGPPAFSPDGRWLAFFSSARGLAPGAPAAVVGEVYLRDLVASNTTWISSNAVALSGYPTNGGPRYLSYHPVLSDDGRFIAFKLSSYTGLGVAAIFQYDLNSNALSVIATNALPLAFNDDVHGPEMTPDGRFIAFASGTATTNLLASANVYLADTVAGTNALVSICQDSTRSTNSVSHSPVLSSDGRFVAFLSNGTNLVANVISNGFHIYLRDTVAGTTGLLDADTNGVATSDQYGNAPSMSADGHWVAFASPDGALVPLDSNRALDVFVRDPVSGTNELVSCREPAAVSVAANGPSSSSQISLTPNGQWLVFSSYADDLVTNDFNRAQDVFVRDLVAGSTALVSVGLDGNSALGGDSTSPVISTNGRLVAFASTATNLVPNYTNQFGDVFIRDLLAGTNLLVSVSADGVNPGHGGSFAPAMSRDGRYVAFLSTASDLVSPPTSAGLNTFWRDTVLGVTVAITTNLAPQTPALFPPSISRDGRYVAFSYPNTVVVWDAQTLTNIYSAPGNSAVSAALSPNGGRLLYEGNNSVKVVDLVGKTNLISTYTLASAQGLAQWSADERFVAFVVRSNRAGVIGTNNQVYLGDLSAGTSALISDTLDHSRGGDGDSDNPVLSADGRYVVYRSSADDIAIGPMAASGIVLYDRASGSNTVLSVGSGGADWLDWASRPLMDAQAQTVVFQSSQSSLATADLNRLPDLFSQTPDVTRDSDGDGIPDWWMMKYFGHPTGSDIDHSRAQDDADGDGFTNYQEFLTGTDPTDPGSYFRVQISTTASPGQNALLSWPAVAGRSYQVQYTADLTNPLWQNLGPAVVATTSGSLNVSPAQPALYYRVIAIN
jgi:Tol biopolymer transport system component